MDQRTLIFLCALLASWSVRAERPAPSVAMENRTRETPVMGTSLELSVWGPSGAKLEEALDAAEREIRRVEDVMTDWRDSPLMEINRAAGKGPRPVARELAAIIGRSLAVSRLTGGAFDPTFASAGKLWDFKASPPVIPSDESVKAAIARIGAGRVTVDAQALTVDLPKGMRLGLGGIAKGYGVDRAMEHLQKRGIKHAMVSAGGDMKLLGRNGTKPWEVAIKHPRDRDRAIAVVQLSNQCLVTSGDYERFFEHEGKRYHHILDPRTGYPATGCMSASVVAPNAEYADALATALCVITPAKGLALIETLDRVECILVDLEGRVHASSGLKPKLVP